MSKLQSTHWQKQGKNARKITKRIVIEGDSVLETPTRFGNGDRDGLTDLTISRDALDGRPLLPGASIAGALRSYLRTRGKLASARQNRREQRRNCFLAKRQK